jgi:ribose 5-phosphate isomerase A
VQDKELVGREAARYVQPGMLVGLGTGSTADFFIRELARRVREDGLEITAVASSHPSALLAEELGLPLVAAEQVAALDLYVDGADEITPERHLLKGRGFDLVKEKLLAASSARFLVLADASKLVDRLGARFPVPVEVLPFARRSVARRVEALGGRAVTRRLPQQDALAVTAQGNLVLDVAFAPGVDIAALDIPLRQIPGVAEHGIFRGLASAVLVAEGGEVRERFA